MDKKAESRNWYNLQADEVISSLDSSSQGLSSQEAASRLDRFGPNELIEKARISPWTIFLRQFKNFLIIILLIAVIFSAILGEIADSVVIFAIVVFAAALGFVQEYRAERAMEALKKMTAPTSSVMRDGGEVEIAARELVPGDVIFLRTGDKIPADSRLIEAVNLKTNEASLTGESVPVDKISDLVPGDAGIGDRTNMVFTGTSAVWGRGKAIVTDTGMATEFGKIATMLQEVTVEKTPLEINLNRLGKWIGIGALSVCFILAAIGVMRGNEILEMLIWGISLAVAAVPEALPAVVTISLALGVQRMTKRHALIRRLPAVETLGSTTYICTDKTGTLTQNQMTIRRIWVNDKLIDVTGVGYEPKGEFMVDNEVISAESEPALQTLLVAGALCNDTSLALDDGVWAVKGDPTEGALVVIAGKAGLQQDELKEKYPRIDEIPFSSERKKMATVHQTPDGKMAYSKGAPEIILEACNRIFVDGSEKAITREDREKVLDVAQSMASDALRILGIAVKHMPESGDKNESPEQDMVFTGLVGMIDPPREEVKEAIKLCDQAGIKTVMVTGDHKLTAVAIGEELGLLKGEMVITGAELDEYSEAEFEDVVEKIGIYARVSPEHKLRVVEALTRKGHVVAMTGDGINDAPALKKADIGVAMGITGTDVTKEAADMVLTDDNFASIVAAVEEGRGIFNNISKFLVFLLSSNLGEILLMAVAILFGTFIGIPYGALPLIAIQILWVNLATDGLPAIALAVDPSDPDIMKQKPFARGKGIFTRPIIILMITGGIWSSIVNLWIFKWALDSDRSMIEAQGLTFMTLILIQLFKAYNFRSDKHSLFKIGFFKNKWLNLSVVFTIATTALLLYVPFLQEVFHTFALNLADWIIVILASSTIFIVLEITKLILSWQRTRKLAEAN